MRSRAKTDSQAGGQAGGQRTHGLLDVATEEQGLEARVGGAVWKVEADSKVLQGN
jgi:hypothetical protein